MDLYSNHSVQTTAGIVSLFWQICCPIVCVSPLCWGECVHVKGFVTNLGGVQRSKEKGNPFQARMKMKFQGRISGLSSGTGALGRNGNFEIVLQPNCTSFRFDS